MPGEVQEQGVTSLSSTKEPLESFDDILSGRLARRVLVVICQNSHCRTATRESSEIDQVWSLTQFKFVSSLQSRSSVNKKGCPNTKSRCA